VLYEGILLTLTLGTLPAYGAYAHLFGTPMQSLVGIVLLLLLMIFLPIVLPFIL